MNHLTVDEIIEFVSSNDLNDEAFLLINKVNEHIRECQECLELVQSFQMIYDEFSEMCSGENFENYIYNVSRNGKGEFLSRCKKTLRRMEETELQLY